ncbi:hypothetical protein GJ744_001591 [Endocarpon pusillum]|uniref:intramembrane prenyl-peptidase Rce1 n=1 Tax=Endocarpon pusillum TaxID=364733 RepID=A0A8H7ABH0_9EURO|nr:hypothetical protein GJ744_001591 [Endocarpon pusillum]
MSPTSLLNRLKPYYDANSEKDLPIISTNIAASLSILFTLVYVLPFYLFPSTRPSPNLNRDAPTVIRARIRTVSFACFISTLSTIYLIHYQSTRTANSNNIVSLETLHLLGYWPLFQHFTTSLLDPLLLTSILFLGPLFEKLVIQQSYRHWLTGPTSLPTTLRSSIGFRNYVAGPITEEILFRSVIIPLHLLARISPTKIVFLTPLYFGIAHVHHFYEFTLTHPHTSTLPALLRSLFQFTYTTLFGWYAAFLYLRTGSLVTVILVHSLCNWCGLPRFWGRVEAGEPIGPPRGFVRVEGRGKGDDEIDVDIINAGGASQVPGLDWTVAYYSLLSIGAYGFKAGLWRLTESSNALASFGET